MGKGDRGTGPAQNGCCGVCRRLEIAGERAKESYSGKEVKRKGRVGRWRRAKRRKLEGGRGIAIRSYHGFVSYQACLCRCHTVPGCAMPQSNGLQLQLNQAEKLR